MSSNEKQKKISVVIPAAGNGERFGGNVPKQFTTVIKKPILQYTVETFMAVPYVSEIIIIIKKQHVNDHLNKLLQNLREKKEIEIKIIEGDKYRHSSISNGISAIKCDPPPDVVIIHDAVRPVFTPELVTKVANLARIHGACGTVRPLVSTVVSINDDGFMDYSLDRCKFRASEMPQAFQYDIIKMAYQMVHLIPFNLTFKLYHTHLLLRACLREDIVRYLIVNTNIYLCNYVFSKVVNKCDLSLCGNFLNYCHSTA
ncbi:ISPD (predicted) [Pycnogonum litorale]